MLKYTIKKDTLISEIAKRSSEAVEIMSDYGLTCATCFLGQFETIEQGAKLHGMTDEEVKKMIKELNEVIKNGKK